MAKLQQVVRKDESTISSVNLPFKIIDQLGWKKGDNLEITLRYINNKPIIIIEKNND
jgi:hypothetical protein